MSKAPVTTKTQAQASDAAASEHDHFHLPPNSWAPLSVSLALCLTFVGLLAHPVVVIVGMLWLVLSLVAWFLGARREYFDLPESETP